MMSSKNRAMQSHSQKNARDINLDLVSRANVLSL